MDNNYYSTGQIKGTDFSGPQSASANSIRENLNEFKDCVRLHEKGLQIQDDCVKQSELIATAQYRTKKKTVSAVVKSVNNKVSSEDLDEVNELRMNFAERHR